MFGWGLPAPPRIVKQGCDSCEPIHNKKKYGEWKCVCDCHEPKKLSKEQLEMSLNNVSSELDWDSHEEITKPWGSE